VPIKLGHHVESTADGDRQCGVVVSKHCGTYCYKDHSRPCSGRRRCL
jgi:hypothetical protein